MSDRPLKHRSNLLTGSASKGAVTSQGKTAPFHPLQTGHLKQSTVWSFTIPTACMWA